MCIAPPQKKKLMHVGAYMMRGETDSQKLSSDLHLYVMATYPQIVRSPGIVVTDGCDTSSNTHGFWETRTARAVSAPNHRAISLFPVHSILKGVEFEFLLGIAPMWAKDLFLF